MPAQRHAFAFQTGRWKVRHRKLAERLVGFQRRLEFGGICEARELLGGAGNVDDFVIDDPSGSYRAANFRRIDPATGEWSIYCADERRAGLDPPMRGAFVDGVGTFYGHDSREGASVHARFLWSHIPPRLRAVGAGLCA